MARKLSNSQIEWAYQQYLDGVSVQKLAVWLGVSDQTIYRTFAKYKKGKTFKWHKRTII